MRALESDRGGITNNREFCSRNGSGTRARMVSRLGRRGRRSVRLGFQRDKSRRLIRTSVLVCENERFFASVACANGSIEVNLIIADNLVPRHRFKLDIRQTSRSLRDFNGRRVLGRAARAGNRCKRKRFVTHPHDFPQKGRVRSRLGGHRGRGRSCSVRNLLGNARSSPAPSVVTYGGTKRSRRDIKSSNGGLRRGMRGKETNGPWRGRRVGRQGVEDLLFGTVGVTTGAAIHGVRIFIS